MKELFPCDRIGFKYFSGSKLSPWKLPNSSNKLRLITRTFSTGGFMNVSFRVESVRLATLAQDKLRGVEESLGNPLLLRDVSTSLDMRGKIRTNNSRQLAVRKDSGSD